MIETVNLTLGYNALNIFENVSIQVPDQKITVLIGANGSGKSTLLKAMARLLSPRTGAIFINGENIANIKTKDLAKQLSMLPQSAIAPSDLSIYDLAKQGRYPYHNLISHWTKKDEELVFAAIKKMGLYEIKDTNLGSLSGGQKQRAWIALALAQDTGFIFLDEPTNHLDMRYQIEILEILKSLNRQDKRTIVMVLHDVNYAMKYSDYIVALKDGKIYASGEKECVISEEVLSNIYEIRCKLYNIGEDELVCIPSI